MITLTLSEMELIQGGSWNGWVFLGCWLAGAAATTLSAPLGPIAAVGGALTYASCLALNK